MLTSLGIQPAFGFTQRTVPSKVVFEVRDDVGTPVENVAVDGGFLDVSQAGAHDNFQGVTDKNGIFRAKGRALTGICGRFLARGHYDTMCYQEIRYDDIKTMERWDITIPILLRRIRNPIAMYWRDVSNRYLSPFESVGKYCLSRTSSYDIVMGDFLPPYGQGQETDLVFTWSMTIYSSNGVGRALDHDMFWEAATPNGRDGICKGDLFGDPGNNHEGSAFLSDYLAPTNGYERSISTYNKVRYSAPRTASRDTNDDNHYLYYFRVRTQTNATGQVTNALYGKIHGQLNGNFRCYLNPTPNDRNVEADPKMNLFDHPSGSQGRN